ncbi:MAG: succinylglutamate desuccinylase/aspartoacylase family protein, partial [Bacteroidales bacterium]|nr:succinylglutamate desuccinylase/aspartoacylase family protein [Bacteroidales bacterium]
MHKLTLSACFLLLTAVLLQAQPHAALQKKVYPNPEGITFTTPTLSIDENRFASYEEIMAWLDVRARDPRMTCTTIGTTTKGRAVPMYRLHNDTKGPKVKVWLQGAIHGNEPAAAEGLFMLTDYLLRTPEGGKLLDRMDVYILPMANLDGYLANKRVSGDGYDLNRDQTKFADPQSVMIKRAFMQVNPDVAVDFHEFQPNRPVKVHSEEPNAILYYDALFLPTGYPNVPQTLRDATIRLMEEPCAAAL